MTAGMDISTAQKLQDSLKVIVQLDVPSGGSKWLLRNLTAREFVRLHTEHGIHHEESCVHVQGSDWLSLDKAMLIRTWWSGGGHSKDPMNRIGNGLWSGHRFDIIANVVEDFGPAWRDVTDEVVRDAKALGLENNVSPP